MENLLHELKKEQTDDPSTNLLHNSLNEELIILKDPDAVENNEIETKHDDRQYLQEKVYSKSVCRLCVTDFLSMHDRDIHRKRVHFTKRDTLSESSTTSFIDQIIDNGIDTYYCNLCSFKSDVMSSYKDHIKPHSGLNLTVISISKDAPYTYENDDTSFHCKLCEFKCNEQSDMKTHVNTPHLNKYSECNVTTSKPLANQMENCTTDIIHQCTLCNCKFDIIETWFCHRKYHLEKKPRSISMSKNALYVFEHLGKQFHCKLCKYNTTNHSTMQEHVNRTHLNVKQNICEICGKRFYNSAQLVCHVRTHTGEKPYKCTICNYASNKAISKHMKMHNKIKPHHCNVCEYKSPNKFRLKLHMRTHTGEKPFKCLICNYAATHKVSLISHMKTKHGNAV